MLSTLPVVPSVGNTLSQAVYLTSYFTLCVILLMCAYTMCDFFLEHSSDVCIYQFCTLASLQQVDVFVNVPLSVTELRRLSAAKVSTGYGPSSASLKSRVVDNA